MVSLSRIKIVLPLAFLAIAEAWVFAGFAQPTAKERESAVGSLAGMGQSMRRSFTDGGFFQAKKEPGTADWLAHHEETGQ